MKHRCYCSIGNFSSFFVQKHHVTYGFIRRARVRMSRQDRCDCAGQQFKVVSVCFSHLKLVLGRCWSLLHASSWVCCWLVCFPSCCNNKANAATPNYYDWLKTFITHWITLDLLCSSGHPISKWLWIFICPHSPGSNEVQGLVGCSAGQLVLKNKKLAY